MCLRQTTPDISLPHIYSFCHGIAKTRPLYVPVHPCPNQEVHRCFTIVLQHISNNGGTQINGWVIWVYSNVFIEAEAHAVWEDNTGRLIDIACSVDAMDKILFIPDPDVKYEGALIDNIRQPIVADSTVQEFCDLDSELTREKNKCDDTEHPGYIVISDRMRKIVARMQQLHDTIVDRYSPNR